ncbi:MAG: hypothetical protein ACFFAG_19715 [Promethearchaeota archaeon]
MAKDKTLDYHILKNLHFQNEYSHFIYRNTNRAAMRQRGATFWRIAELPIIFLALIEICFIFATNNWVVGGWTLFFTALCVILIYTILYNIVIKKKNQHEEEIMNFNSTLIWIQNSMDQVEIIDRYEIESMGEIKTSKVEEIEDLINEDLSDVFKRFKGQKIDKIMSFLSELNLKPLRLKERFERFRDFMRKQLEGYEGKNLRIIIQYLQALENKNLTRLNALNKELSEGES